MATKKIPSFLESPKRDQCTGRIASLASQLVAEGYSPRHIAFAASIVADDFARRENLDTFRRFLKFTLTHAREGLAETQPFVTWEESEHGDPQIEFLESL